MINPTRHKTTRRDCCTELKCESGLRNNYFEGKQLTVDSFRVEQKYLMERRWLLNRAIHGWGVVYGYSVTATAPGKAGGQRRLMVGAGLALDECGRELLQTATPLQVDDLIILNESGVPVDAEKVFSAVAQHNQQADDSRRICWLLSVHYAEQKTAPVTIKDPCHCDYHAWDHTCETVRYSLRPIRCEECCRAFECELTCDCGAGRCCDRPENPDDADKPHQRGGCRCLCDYLTQLVPGAECGCLYEIEEPCAFVKVDLQNGVPLACVELVRDECDRWVFGDEVEACGPRRLVKRNDLLFDLIRGCDLTNIIAFGWKNWHRREEPISFEDFSESLGPENVGQAEYLTRLFWVKFSRPVRQDTLRPDCFAMTIMSGEREGGWWQALRVPIVRLDTTNFPPEANDPPNHVRGAAIVVDGAWVEDGVRGRRTVFMGGETRVEVEVRGDFIVDCNGQTLDADAVGLSKVPSGNGTPGGRFLSTFRVAPASYETKR